MRRFFNILLVLIVLGALLFVGWKAKLIPDPFSESNHPKGSDAAPITSRDVLRVASADRPEKLMLSSLQRLLKAQGNQVEVVDYNPETVWLELTSGEIDLVVAPIGEAIKAQGRFKPGQFLFFTGLSEGLDQLLANPKVQTAKRVGVKRQAATDFLARQMLPEAEVVAAASLDEVESWLKGGAVDAALIDTSANSPDLSKTFKVLSTTTKEHPMPSVAVLSRGFVENADKPEYETRKKTLLAAIDSWAGLVKYLETQPELLRTTLKKEAEGAGVDVDRLLASYVYLSPSEGRTTLLEYHQNGGLKQIFELLIISGVENLTTPSWDSVVKLPADIDQAFGSETSAASEPIIQASATPDPQLRPTVTATPGQATPMVSPMPATPTPSGTPDQVDSSKQVAAPPTHTYPDVRVTGDWPKPVIDKTNGLSVNVPPALTRKQIAIATKQGLTLYTQSQSKIVNVPLAGQPAAGPVSDGRSFFYGQKDKVVSINSSGKTLWEVAVKGIPMFSPSLIEDRLVLAANEGDRGRLLCLDPVDGERLWDIVVPSPLASPPVIGGADKAIVIALDENGDVQALDLKAGGKLWSKKLTRPVYLGVATGFGKLAITEPEGTVRLWSLKDGSEIWTSNLGTSLTAPPTITAGTVLVPSKDTYLYALNSSNGAIRWKTRLAQTMSEPAIIVGENILQSDEGGQLQVVRLRDGELLSNHTMGKGWVSQPVFFDNAWAVLEDSGKFRMYRAE